MMHSILDIIHFPIYSRIVFNPNDDEDYYINSFLALFRLTLSLILTY